MKKILFLSIACLMTLCAMAQIDAIRVTQGETTDWYPFGKSDRIDVTIYEQGNPVIEGKIYDLSKGNVETAFGTDPFPEIKAAAIAEINAAATTANEEIDGLGVDESAKNEAKADIDNIAHTAEQTINAATSKDAIDNAKTEAIAKIHDVVQTTKDMWVIVRTDGTAGNWNTICLERNITTIDGATFWTVSGQNATSFILDEVTEPEAGQGYIIRFTKSDLKVKYGDQMEANPVTASYGNPIQGTFTQIDAAETNVLVGNYIVYENQLRKVVSWVGLYDHRAYVVADLVPNGEPQHAPKAARMTMPKPNGTPTELKVQEKGLRNEEKGLRKVIENGQFRIIRNDKRYTIMGVEE